MPFRRDFCKAFRDISFWSGSPSCPQTQEECCFWQCYFNWSKDNLLPWTEIECEKGQVTLSKELKKCVNYQSLEIFLLTSLL